MKYLLSILILSLSMVSCNDTHTGIQRISSPGKNAESVYLTHDEDGNPVIAWTEREDNKVRFLYATTTDDGESFTTIEPVVLNDQVATHAEGMPKVAFKKNGTIIVAYEKKAPTSENKYAGAIYYITSSNEGKSWSAERFLHSDTVSGRSRSYFDIETLPDGEIGASWLDIKLNKETGGRSVRFAKTNSQNFFSDELLIDSSACQCCRTDVYADDAGNVNVAYRGLIKGQMGQTIRDMMIASSDNHGRAFTNPLRISVDNWNIDGCPHTGPALCSSKGNLQALWYTEGSGAGIYYASKKHGENGFDAKQVISSFGHHPQASSNNRSMAIVWEENTVQKDNPITRVHCQIASDDEIVTRTVLSPEAFNAYLPVVINTKNGFLTAFVMETEGETGVYFKKL
jgi:hypothetical protein